MSRRGPAPASASQAGAAKPRPRLSWRAFLPKHPLDRWAILVSLSCAAVALSMMSRFSHPSGSDPGQWLSMAKLFLGETGADLNILQYPPLVFMLLAAFLWITGSAIAAAFLLMGTIVFLIPLAGYFAYAAVAGDRRGALIFAACIGLGQPFLDMLSWGAYPNLFSFPFLLLASAWLLRCSRPDARPREFFVLGLFAGLTFLSHPLSALLFGATATAFALLLYVHEREWRWLLRVAVRALPVFAVLYVPYITAAVSSGAYQPSYLTDPSAYAFAGSLLPLVPWYLRGIFPFGEIATVAVIVGVVAAAAFPFTAHRMARDRGTLLAWALSDLAPSERSRVYALFVAMFVPPFLVLGALWAAGLYSDFTRLMFFPALSGAAAVAAVLSRWVARSGGERNAVQTNPSVAPPTGSLPSPIGPWLRGLTAPGSRRTVGLCVVLILLANSASGLTYFDQASHYYLVFADPADLQLSDWVASHAQFADVVLLSPDPGSAGSIKWLEGLTGRQTIGYREARELYYERERAASHDAYVMLSYAYAIASPEVEVGTPGAVPGTPIEIRYAVFEGFTPVPVLALNDTGIAVEFQDGSLVNLSAFDGHSVALDRSVAGEPRIISRAFDAYRGLDVTRIASVQGSDIQTEFIVSSWAQRVVALRLNFTFASPPCAVEAFPGGALVSAGSLGLCAHTRLRIPSDFTMNTTSNGREVRMNYTSGQTSFSFENLGQGKLLSGGVRVLDSKEIVRDRGVRFIAVSRLTPMEAEFIKAAYGFPVAYDNAKYTVFGVP